MGITYGDHLINSGHYDITPEQEREIEAREECALRGIDPDDICADGGVTAWMVVDQEMRNLRAQQKEGRVMDLRRLAELSLAGYRCARRTGQVFKISEDRCAMLGISPQDIKRVEAAVFLIEDYSEGVLSTLENRPEVSE